MSVYLIHIRETPVEMGLIQHFDEVLGVLVPMAKPAENWRCFFFIASHLGTAVASVRTHARPLNTRPPHTTPVYKQTYSYTQI